MPKGPIFTRTRPSNGRYQSCLISSRPGRHSALSESRLGKRTLSSGPRLEQCVQTSCRSRAPHLPLARQHYAGVGESLTSRFRRMRQFLGASIADSLSKMEESLSRLRLVAPCRCFSIDAAYDFRRSRRRLPSVCIVLRRRGSPWCP
jgi:hypothetical protein